MAYEIPGQVITLPASTDMSGLQYRFVTAGADGRAALPAAGASVLGVLQNKPTEDQAASIMVSGVSKVECTVASTIGDGDIVAASSIGGAVALSAGDYAVGRVVEGSSGSTGRIFSVLLQPIGTT